MTDEEILYELREQRHWWETQLEEVETKVKEYKEQITKATRLIVLLEEKIYNKEE